MPHQPSAKTEVAPRAETIANDEGRYLYCVADAGERVSLGEIGIQGNEVYTVPYQDICAIVHSCPAEPYLSSDQEAVKVWIMAHHRVVDAAWERWSTVLPFSFDTMIKAEIGGEGRVRDWLEVEYPGLKRKLEKVRGKAEYGIQIFWDPKVIAKGLTQTSSEIGKLAEEIGTKPKGLAYMYRQKLDKLLRQEMEAKADECFKVLYRRIRKHADDIRVEKIKEAEPGWQMILNLSCLACRDSYQELGEELDKINQMEGFSVRFTGPWPPYSFVGSA